MTELMPFLYYLYVQYGVLVPTGCHSCRHHIWQLNFHLGGHWPSFLERLSAAIGRMCHHRACLLFSSEYWSFPHEKVDAHSFWVFHVSSYVINLQWEYYFICTHHYYRFRMVIFSYFNPHQDYIDSDAHGHCCWVDLVLWISLHDWRCYCGFLDSNYPLHCHFDWCGARMIASCAACRDTLCHSRDVSGDEGLPTPTRRHFYQKGDFYFVEVVLNIPCRDWPPESVRPRPHSFASALYHHHRVRLAQLAIYYELVSEKIFS